LRAKSICTSIAAWTDLHCASDWLTAMPASRRCLVKPRISAFSSPTAFISALPDCISDSKPAGLKPGSCPKSGSWKGGKALAVWLVCFAMVACLLGSKMR